MSECPLCLNVDGTNCQEAPFHSGNCRHECDACGFFITTDDARDDYLGSDVVKTNKAVRAALSYWARQRFPVKNSDDLPWVTTGVVEACYRGEIFCPSPAQQATNIVRFLGNDFNRNGEYIDGLPSHFRSTIGANDRFQAGQLVSELIDRGVLVGSDASTMNGPDYLDLRLTLSGWEVYESEKQGAIDGNYGFIALKFNDEILDPFLKNHIRPAVESLGINLRDMRDSSRAGIIDNLLRVEIRDSKFVLVDLTHDNAGAYWEAGYAEGLGKPVLYICEQAKFDEAKTHFDTNHCTTVLWNASEPGAFKENLVATLKRSLNL